MAITVRVIKAPGAQTYLEAVYTKKRHLFDPLFRKFRKRKIQKTATRHYQNALSQFKRIFESAAVLQGVGEWSGQGPSWNARAIRYIDGEGKAHKFTTKPWPALTGEYADRFPTSRRFWRKRGKLARLYKKEVPVRSAKAEVDTKRVRRIEKTNRVRVLHHISFTALPNPVVTTLIGETFAQGSSGPAEGFKAHGLSRESSELMGYPEAAQRRTRGGRFSHPVNRPFIAQLSGRLGREMHRAIRKL